jgi:hypothetical protein
MANWPRRPAPTEVLRARAFIRQTWGLGGGEEKLEADFNQFARTVDKQRVVLTAGNFSVLDVFDRTPTGPIHARSS